MKNKIDSVAFYNDIVKKHCRNKQKSKIHPLAPDKNLDIAEYEKYENFLNSAFCNKEIRNIAVSGSYGIGKSSIVHTFEKQNHKKFLYVSLMDCSGDEDGNRIEITILRQILTNCVRSKFPRLRFRMIPEEMEGLRLKSCLFSVYICLLICVIFSEKLSDIFHMLNIDLYGYGTPILYLLFLLSTFFLVFLGISWGLKFFKIKEINLKLARENAEAESGASSCEESVLDEYRFDLIYVLENLSKDYNAIIFEDIDRLDSEKCISVFHQLREINLGLNARKKVGKFPFRFLYVVNDELMEKINQTKFFDYIMSVVPSLGAENAKDKFQRFVLDDLGIKLIGKDKECIFRAIDASIMLKDYRTLKQIKNDYTLFSSIADATGVAIDRCQGVLLGFIIYKVLWPQDYHLIRSGKSLVFPKWIDNKIEINKEWKRRYGDASIIHDEYEAIKEMKDILTNGTCLKFIGYSKEDRISYYKDTLTNASTDQKRELLLHDDDFICGSILFESPNDIKTYISGLENEFILYLVRFYSDYSQQYDFEKFIENLTDTGTKIVSAAFVSEVENALKDTGDEVGVYIFAVRCFLKLGYCMSGSDTANAYGWFYHSNSSILKQRMQSISGEFTDNDYRTLLSNFSMLELIDLKNATDNYAAQEIVNKIIKEKLKKKGG